MILNTMLLKGMVSKAIKGAGLNQHLPLTNMMLIEVVDNELRLVTTDGNNTFVVKSKSNDFKDNFYVVVPIEIFSKLIVKLTCETVTLELEESNLLVKGNGNYKIALPIDEEGLVNFPKYNLDSINDGSTKIVKSSFIKSVIASNKASLAKLLDTPCMTGYYINNDYVISSDSEVACYNKINLLNDTRLLSPKTLDLLALTNYEDINYEIGKRGEFEILKFANEDIELYVYELEGKEIFPIEPLMDLYKNTTFKSMCKVPKILLSSVLDRLMLFIEQYDKNVATFTFTQNGLQISSRKMSSMELINYTHSEQFEPFIALLDVKMLKSQIDAYRGEEVEIWYGLSSAIKLQSDNVTQIICLIEEI